MCLFKEKKARQEILKMNESQIDKIVKIQGTDHDRKRKYSTKLIKQIQPYYDAGCDIKNISKVFGISPFMIKYNCDPTFRAIYNIKRNGKHTGVDNITFSDRAKYKKSLVETKKIKVAGML